MRQVATGRIEGTVIDQTGASVAGAKVTVVDVKHDITSTRATAVDGSFIFPSLHASLYRMTVEAPGFSKAVVENIELNVSATVNQHRTDFTNPSPLLAVAAQFVSHFPKTVKHPPGRGLQTLVGGPSHRRVNSVPFGYGCLMRRRRSLSRSGER